ncbi:DUF4838 domain-containing protein [Jiangella gansuensis]|uniref:DUF4838 domain-containing protein n=1 Tax=Jiangella gansuensis TaxID=281473 RepID=UPI0004790282|nr:DUF4838 domain-containing protein [Jiangella gansuensis]
MSGIELPLENAAPRTGLTIRIGSSQGEQSPKIEDLGTSGAVITVQPDVITIVGASDEGTANGVSMFCEQLLGARRLFPGPDGLDVPRSPVPSVPVGRWTHKPSFDQRCMSPFNRREGFDPQNPGEVWALQCRANWLIDQSHGLWAMAPVEKYGNPNLPTYRPDFYPILQGTRVIPAVGGKTSWEPRLSADGFLDVAVAETRARLLANPDAKTFGLGMNDSGRWSDDEVDPSRRNILGYPDMSELYYGFLNELVARLAPEFPDVKFGAIAYQHVLEPPSFQLHPSIVVFLCQERYGWIDDEYRRMDQDLTRRWLTRTESLGWYDYLEDSAYQVPRPTSRVTLEAYRWAKSVGVRYLYTELYPNFSAGPQSFLLPRMMWDVDLDLDAEINDWCRRMVGPSAAGLLRYYYSLWEDFWLKTVPSDGGWFSTGRIYFTFNAPSYLDLVSPELIAKSRQLMKRIVERATRSPDKVHGRRARMIQRGFDLVAATVDSYAGQPPVVSSRQSADQVWTTLKDRQPAAIAQADARRQLIAEFDADPALKQWNAPLALGIDWTGWQLQDVYALGDWAREDPAGPAFLDAVRTDVDSAQPTTATLASYVLAAADPEKNRQLSNFSDMEDIRYAPQVWRLTAFDQTVRTPGLTTETASSGSRSFLIPAGSLSLVYRTVILKSGPVRVRVKVRTAPGTPATFPTGGWQVQLWNTVYLKNAPALTRRSQPLPVSGLTDGWIDLEWYEMLPENVTQIVTRAMVVTSADIYLDDYEVWQFA